MTGFIILLAIIAALVALGAAASRFGVDTRETIDEPHRPMIYA
jgi:hypothetical protein